MDTEIPSNSKPEVDFDDLPAELCYQILGYCNVGSFKLDVTFQVAAPMIPYMLVCKRWLSILQVMGIRTMSKGNSDAYWARYGQLSLLKLSHGQGNQIHGNLAVVAATGNQLETAQWIVETSLGVELDTGHMIVEEFCKHGNLEAVNYFYQLSSSFKDKQHSKTAAEGGHFELVQWLYINGQRFNVNGLLSAAAKSGHIEMMAWLIAKGALIRNTDAMKMAAKGNHLAAMQWLHTKGCPVPTSAFVEAAKNGNLAVMEWLYSKDCAMNEDVFYCLARHDQIELLQWLHAVGCPWGPRVCHLAFRKQHYDILRWLVAAGCPYMPESYHSGPVLVTKSQAQMLKWIRTNI